MGYTTDFEGAFLLDRPLDDETYTFLKKLASTRRMVRDVSKLPKPDADHSTHGFESWGVDGEYYVHGGGSFGQAQEDSVVEYNSSPGSQPNLWCQWVPSDDRLHIRWDGGEKFYDYVEWLSWIIDRVLAPRGYHLSGEVEWQGEDSRDIGKITVDRNTIRTARVVYD